MAVELPLPGKDGVLGTVDVKYISDITNIEPRRSLRKDDVLIEDNAVHIPVKSPSRWCCRNVLHDFFVPQFRARMNLVPGSVTWPWFTPTKIGTFEILCAQLCGVGHYTMRGTVIVDDQSTFDAWLNKQHTFAPARAETHENVTKGG